MKVLHNILIPATFSTLVFFSCESDSKTDLPPEISDVTVGNHEGGDEVGRGEEMHVYFTAKSRSKGNLDYYHILIQDHDEYKIIDEDFKDEPAFKGSKEAIIHEHVLISDTALLGSYHVLITVVDEESNTSNTESLDTHIEVIE